MNRSSVGRLTLWARDQLWVAPLLYAAGSCALAVGLANTGWGAVYLGHVAAGRGGDPRHADLCTAEP